MKIYLDACVLSRLSDDRTQARVGAEAEACEAVFQKIFVGEVGWSASVALRNEVSRNPDLDKRNDALALLSYAGELQEASTLIQQRADALHAVGYGAFDALHLSHAEAESVDALLTTDDRFIKLAKRGLGSPRVWLVNPVDWVRR